MGDARVRRRADARRPAGTAHPRRPPPRRVRDAAPEPGSTPELRRFEADFEEQFGRPPDPYAALTWRATNGVLDALAAAAGRANLRRIVAERYLASPPPTSGFSAFRMRDGAREYL